MADQKRYKFEKHLYNEPMSVLDRETPAEKIKRLERELADEKLRNKILNGMVDIMDNEYGAGLRKKYLSGTSGKPKKGKK